MVTPAGLTRKREPVAVMVPSRREGRCDDAVEGCAGAVLEGDGVALSDGEAAPVDDGVSGGWVTTRLVPEGVAMVAAPAATDPPVGSDWAKAGAAPAARSATLANRGRTALNRLPARPIRRFGEDGVEPIERADRECVVGMVERHGDLALAERGLPPLPCRRRALRLNTTCNSNSGLFFIVSLRECSCIRHSQMVETRHEM